MARITVEDCLKQVGDRFALVHLAATRVKQIKAGAPVKVDAPDNKDVVLALREIAAKKLTFVNQDLLKIEE